jgi:hypothetical protein
LRRNLLHRYLPGQREGEEPQIYLQEPLAPQSDRLHQGPGSSARALCISTAWVSGIPSMGVVPPLPIAPIDDQKSLMHHERADP